MRDEFTREIARLWNSRPPQEAFNKAGKDLIKWLADMVNAQNKLIAVYQTSVPIDKELEFRRGWDSQKKTQATKGALAKIAADPAQREKEFVRKCWEEWQRKPYLYKTKTEFASDMLAKRKYLVSYRVIENWCREWEKVRPVYAELTLCWKVGDDVCWVLTLPAE